jgi:Tol biopolymer transport system component
VLVLGTAALTAIVAAALLATAAMRRPVVEAGVAFTVQAPNGGQLTVGQPLSPDGTKVAFIAASSTGVPMVWVRPMDSIVARSLEGTEGARDLFWSPDSQNLGFFAGGELKRIPASGGAALVICTVDNPEGGSWGSQNVILIGSHGPLVRVSAAGGTTTAATVLDVKAGDQWHTAPEFLPDGRRFLYIVQSGGIADVQAFAGSLDSSDRRALDGVHSAVRFAAPGQVLFTRDGALLARALDVDRSVLSGEPFQVADRAAGRARMPFSASGDGGLAYLTLLDLDTELRWFDRSGTPLELAGKKGSYVNPELSHDGGRIATDRDARGNIDIWALDSTTGSETRVTNHVAADYAPIWSPDDRTLLFTSYRSGFGRMYTHELVGTTGDTPVHESAIEQRASDWSSDGRYLAYMQNDASVSAQPPDLWAIAVGNGSDPIRITHTDATENNVRFSPDVHWVAYESNESGRFEVYVQSFPKAGNRQIVSVGGGRTPRWKPDGTELFYLTDDGTVMAVPVTPMPDSTRFGPPSRLFRADVEFTGGIGRVLNVSPDGRFLLKVVPPGRAPASIVVLNNWAARLRR